MAERLSDEMGRTQQEIGKASGKVLSTGKKAAKGGKKAVKGGKKAAKGGAKAAKGAANAGKQFASDMTNTAGRIKWAVIGGLVVIAIIAVLLTGGVPATSFNSFTGINPAQDPIEDADDDYEDLSDAQKTEIEGMNILGRNLAEQKVEAEEKVKQAAEKQGVSAEATLQMMNANFVTIGGESVEAHQESNEYTEEEFQAGVLLSAYSISVNNLWHWNEDYTGYDLTDCDLTTKDGRAQYIWMRLLGDGCTKEVAAAILGNLEKENGSFDPAVGENGGRGIGRGICQWSKGGSRFKRLQAIAKKKHTTWDTLEPQVDLLIEELNGNEGGWKAGLKNCHTTGISDLFCDTHGYSKHSGYTPKKFKKLKNLEQATCMFRNHFERPGKVASSKVTVRVAAAKKWYTKFKNISSESSGAASETIAKTAERLAYPEGTLKSKWHGGSKIRHKAVKSWGALPVKPTPEFRAAMDKWFPKHWNTKAYGGSYGARYGSCCCHSTKVIVSEAMGKKMPNSLANPEKYKKHGFTVTYVKGKDNINSTLKRGDIVTAKGNGYHHTMIYLGNGKVAEGGLTNCNFSHITKANLGKRYPKGCYIIRAGVGVSAKGGSTSGSISANSSSIVSKAKQLAWPLGTAESKYNYTTGSRTPAYTKALNKAFPKYKKRRARYQTGASCSVFVATTIRASGYDTSFPASKYLQYLKSHPDKWKEVSYTKAKAGDIFYYDTSGASGNHILIYGGYQNGKYLWYQANLGRTASKAQYPYAFYGKNPTTGKYKSSHKNLHVFRASGSGSGSGSDSGDSIVSESKKSRATTVWTIKNSDTTNVINKTGLGTYRTPQSMAIADGNSIIVTCSHTAAKNKAKLYRFEQRGNKYKLTKSKEAPSARHGNGTTFCDADGKVYVVRASTGGGDRHIITKVNANLSGSISTTKLSVTAANIGYDPATQKFIVMHAKGGARLQVFNSNLKDRKAYTLRTRSTSGKFQDCCAWHGAAFGCTMNTNNIDIYNLTNGDYLGTIKISRASELESCCIDSEGHLYLLYNKRSSGIFVYKTKDTIQNHIAFNGEIQSDDFLSQYGPGSWRYDMNERFSEYLASTDYYKMIIEKDEEGKAVKYEGTISTDTNIIEDINDYEEDTRDGVIDTDNGSDAPGSGLIDLLNPGESNETAKEQYEKLKENTSGSNSGTQSGSGKTKKKGTTDDLESKTYIKVLLKQKDIYAFASAAFGINREDVQELYGKQARRDATLRDMSLDQLAVLHGLSNVEDSLVYEESFTEGTDYKIADNLGKFKITTYSNSTAEGTAHMRKILTNKSFNKTSPTRKANVTCAAPKSIPVGTVIYCKKLGSILVVEDTLKDDSNTIAIYTGKKTDKAEKNEKAIKKGLGKSDTSTINLVTGLTTNEARSIGGGFSGKGIKGVLEWGKRICDDQNYTYGGYRCHTCHSNVSKEYVCTTFVRACYAHGAGDSEMLDWCKNAKYGMVADLHSHMKKSSRWKSMGKISQSQMQPGDVIVYGRQHVEIYYGNGKRMGSHGHKGGPDDISITSMYSGWTDVMRYVGPGK